MPGTVTLTDVSTGGIHALTFTWLADASGNATFTTTGSYSGVAASATFTSGTPTPTTGYAVTLKDTGLVDILGGAAASIDSSAVVTKRGGNGLTAIVTTGVLALSISGAGNLARGTLLVLLQPVNSYCTLQQIVNRIDPNGSTALATDDTTILEMIYQASRAIDAFCGGRTFFSRTETRYFDRPTDRQLDFDEDLLSITTLLNGDGSTIAAASYKVYPANEIPKHWLILTTTSGIIWLVDSTGQSMQAIALTGVWGYVNRAATDFRSIQIIAGTEDACIETVVAKYQSRFGENATFNTVVTPSGMVITPRDIPGWAQEYILTYRRGF